MSKKKEQLRALEQMNVLIRRRGWGSPLRVPQMRGDIGRFCAIDTERRCRNEKDMKGERR